MALRFVTHEERPDLQARWYDVSGEVWPELMLHDATVNRYWNGLGQHFPDCQLYLLDDQADTLVGVGNTVPVAWDGTVDGLPGGIDDVLTRAIGGYSTAPAAIGSYGTAPAATALCALQAALLPGNTGQGLSTTIIREMREVAVRRGLSGLIAPVRPSQKTLYPLTPMERYIGWRRPDGLPQDPWLRVHARLGAEIVRVAEHSMVIEGCVAEWEVWTGLTFPDSGPYVVAGALVPITIDREADRGRYVEPNVWMRSPL